MRRKDSCWARSSLCRVLVISFMLFGHNSNVSAEGLTFHVQTEDRGAAHAQIDTAVYFRGHVLHRRTKNYSDLLPLNADREQALKLRVDEQHRTVIEEIRSGKLHLVVPEAEKLPAEKTSPIAKNASGQHHVELLNARTWLTGKRAFLQIAVRDQTQNAVEGAKVTARVEGAARPTAFSTETGPFGHAQIEFDMPPLASTDVALVIESAKGDTQGHLRFHLRVKPHASQ
ncbi:MAG TPA: hypothetical protein VE263_18105 [Candidatus Angelobacter sp.]|nr:hypothetical protein [Candidatus Angelobacter sp.]